MSSVYPASVVTASTLLVAVNNSKSVLRYAVGAGDTTLIFPPSATFVSNSVVTIGAEIIKLGTYTASTGTATGCTRGYDGTTAAAHNASAPAQSLIVAAHHNNLRQEVEAIETALGANLSNIASFGISISSYTFSVTPAQALTAHNVSTYIFTTLPAGISALSVNHHYLRIVDAVAGNETVMITGVNVGTKQITFTPYLSHASGNWTLGSASSGIQEAIVAASASSSATIYLGSGTIQVYAQIWAGVQDGHSITIQGNGPGWPLISRHSSYPNGNIFLLDGTVASNGSYTFRDFRILGSDSTFNVFGGYGVNIVTSGNTVLIDNVVVYDGYGGYSVADSSYVTIRNSRFLQSVAYSTAGYQAISGLRLSQHVNNFLSLGSVYETQHQGNAFALLYGVLIEGADGVEFVGGAANGKYGMYIHGVGDPIDDVYVSNMIFDNVPVSSLVIDGTTGINPYTNLRFVGCHFNPGGYAGGLNAINITGSADYIQFIGGNVNLAYNSGIGITPQTAYHGAAQRMIEINGMDISGNGLAAVANLHGINIGNGASGLRITNNLIGKRNDVTGTLTYNIAITGTLSDSIITGNSLGQALNAPFYYGGAITTSLIINNQGVDNVLGTVASAASIALPIYPNFTVTGSTGIGTVTGQWAGQKGTMIAPSGVTFTAGASIGNTITLTANQLYSWWSDGTKIYIG